MKNSLVAVAALLALSAAHATECANGAPPSAWPDCVLTPAAPAPVKVRAEATASSDQRQQQGQAQQQAQQTRQQANGNGAGAGSGSGIVTIHGAAAGSGDNYKSLSVALPSVAPAIAPTLMGGPVAQAVFGECGPMQRVEATARTILHFGPFGSVSERQFGHDEYTKPYQDHTGTERAFIQRDGYLIGHQQIRYAAQVVASSSTSIGIGGFGSNGGGNGGASSAGGISDTQLRVRLVECIKAVYTEDLPPPKPAAFKPQPPVVKVVVPPKRRVVRPPCVTHVIQMRPVRVCVAPK